MPLTLTGPIGENDQVFEVTGGPLPSWPGTLKIGAELLHVDSAGPTSQASVHRLVTQRGIEWTDRAAHPAGAVAEPVTGSATPGGESRARTLRAPLDVGVIQTVGTMLVSRSFTGLPRTPRLLRAVLSLTTVGGLPATDWWVVAQLGGTNSKTVFVPGGLTQPVGLTFMWTGVGADQTEYLAEVVALGSDTIVVETDIDRSSLVIEDLGEPA